MDDASISRPEDLTREKRTLTREERLAQKLRENLRRRKAQARELGQQTPDLPKTPTGG
jgi:FtsZ-binding cell division protein ZapB